MVSKHGREHKPVFLLWCVSFLGFAITNSYKLGNLKQKIYLLMFLEAGSLKSRCEHGWFPAEALRENLSLASSWLLVATGLRGIARASASLFLWPVSLGPKSPSAFLLQGYLSLDWFHSKYEMILFRSLIKSANHPFLRSRSVRFCENIPYVGGGGWGAGGLTQYIWKSWLHSGWWSKANLPLMSCVHPSNRLWKLLDSWFSPASPSLPPRVRLPHLSWQMSELRTSTDELKIHLLNVLFLFYMREKAGWCHRNGGRFSFTPCSHRLSFRGAFK